MIITALTFNCDRAGCTRSATTSGFINFSEAMLHEMLVSRGWERHGNKCYCPGCAEIRDKERHEGMLED